MGAQLRAVRRRISTVKSTAKITKAQELIASSRIIKAQQRAQAAGPYAREITAALLDAFALPAEDGGVDEIHLVYTEFVSMLTQRPVIHRLLPLEITEVVEERAAGPIPIYEFEPSPEQVLDALLPWYVESRI